FDCGMYVIKVLMDTSSQYNKWEYYQNLDVCRLKTLAWLMGWENNYIKDEVLKMVEACAKQK
ncbi:hypothetical protein SOVF_189080, partial [Spinacia oleracea]